MKCWHEDCNKKLRMDIVKVGFCPEHGQVWEDSEPISNKMKKQVARMIGKQAPDRIIAMLLSRMSGKMEDEEGE